MPGRRVELTAKPHSTTAIVVLDRSPVLRDALGALLVGRADCDVVASAGSRDDALRYVGAHKPDVVILGPRVGHLADEVGGDLVGAILASSPGSAVLLTVADPVAERSLVVEAIEAGAAGVFDLTAPTESFVDALTAVAAGRKHIPSDLAIGLLGGVREGALSALTERELELLKEISLGYTNAEIAARLHLSVRTVESHRARIQSKLGLFTRAELVRLALDHGLLR